MNNEPQDGDRADQHEKAIVADTVPDEREAVLLRNALSRDLSPMERIGIGLKALYNYPLLEQIPERLRVLLGHLHTKHKAGDKRDD